MLRQVRFNRVSDKVNTKALVQSQVRSNKVPEEVPGSFGAGACLVQQVSGQGFVAEPVRFNSVPETFPEKVWEVFVQSQVRFKGSGVEVGSCGAGSR